MLKVLLPTLPLEDKRLGPPTLPTLLRVSQGTGGGGLFFTNPMNGTLPRAGSRDCVRNRDAPQTDGGQSPLSSSETRGGKDAAMTEQQSCAAAK